MRSTFRDPDLQRRFAADGFVRIPLLAPEQAAELRGTWERIQPGLGPGFHPSLLSQDEDYRLAARREAIAVLGPAVDRFLDDHRTYAGNFLVKVPGPESELDCHQDRTCVDESRFTGLGIWCPLTDTDTANGTLYVVPGSHRWADYPRSESPGWPKPWMPFREVLRERASVEQPVRAGEALVFDTRLIHWSPPNASERARVVAICGAVPAEATMRHLELTADGTVEVYRVDDPAFFDSHIPGTPATGLECVERFTLEVPELDLADLDPSLVPAPPPPPTPDPPRPLRRIGWMLPHPARHVARRLWDGAYRRVSSTAGSPDA